MINVIVIKHNDHSGLSTGKAMEQVVNHAAEQVANGLRNQLKDAKCTNHPESNPTIKVIAGQNPSLRYEKLNFCCDDFKNSIQLKS